MTKQGTTVAAPSDFTVGEETPNLVPEVHSIRGNVAEALVIKNGNLFFLSEPDGTVPLAPGHGSGFYYHDCRFLNGYELRICGKNPEMLVRNADRGFMATFGLSNRGHESAIGIADQHFWFLPADSELIAVEKPAI